MGSILNQGLVKRVLALCFSWLSESSWIPLSKKIKADNRLDRGAV